MSTRSNPKDWKPVKLDELGLVARGKSKHRPRNDPALFGGDYPFVQTGDVRAADLYLTSYEQTYSDLGLAQSKLWDPGTLCITIAANIAETAILGMRACFPDSIVGFVPHRHLADVRFVKYYIDTIKLRMQSASHGTTQDNLSVDKLLTFDFVVPAVTTQHRIAAILSSYDDLIENNTKRIKVLEEMARSLYREWFVQFRYPGHEKVKLVDSALGKVPEGWDIKRLDQLYQTASGGTPSRKYPEYFLPSGEGIPWVKTKELLDGWIMSTDESISAIGLKSSSAKLFPENTLLVAMYGATIGQLGLLGVPAATNQACCAILPLNGSNSFGPYFAWCFFLENRERIIGLGLGAAQPNISQIVVRGLTLPKPPDALALRFERFCIPLFEQLRNLHHRNVLLRQTRDMLLPKLISGEIDVTKTPGAG